MKRILRNLCTGWCGSVDWVPACEPKGCWFNSQFSSRAHAWVAGQEATCRCFSHTLMFLYLSIFLLSTLSKKINKGLFNKKQYKLPWLVWLSGLSTGLWTRGSPVRFPVRAHAWVAGREAAHQCFSHTLMFLYLSFFLPSTLSKKQIKSLKKEKRYKLLTCHPMWYSTHLVPWIPRI